MNYKLFCWFLFLRAFVTRSCPVVLSWKISHTDSRISPTSSLKTFQLFANLLHKLKIFLNFWLWSWEFLFRYSWNLNIYIVVLCCAICVTPFPPKGLKHRNTYIWVTIPTWWNHSKSIKKFFLYSTIRGKNETK